MTATGNTVSTELTLREKLGTNSRARFWAVLLGHFTIDTYSGMGAVLLAFLSVHLIPMTNTQIGFAVSAYQLVGGISQPVFGLISDRSGGRFIGVGGMLWTAGFLALTLVSVTLTQNYILMLIPFVLASLGSGAFHPVGTMHAGGTHGKSSVGKLSWFFLAGQLGGALGPAITGLLLDSAATHHRAFTAGLPTISRVISETGTPEPLFMLILIGLPSILLMALTLPSRNAYDETKRSAAVVGGLVNPKVSKWALGLLALTITLRSVSNPGMVAFLPRLFQEKGWTAAEYGFVTSMFWLSAGIAGVIFGMLAAKYSAKTITALSLIFSAPAVFLLPSVDGAFALVVVLAAGALTGGSHSLLIAMSQRLMPKSRGFASGAALGFIFATGAVGTVLIGGLSDRIGLSASFQLVAVVTVITGLISFTLTDETS